MRDIAHLHFVFYDTCIGCRTNILQYHEIVVAAAVVVLVYSYIYNV
jgi:hypothetical protein